MSIRFIPFVAAALLSLPALAQQITVIESRSFISGHYNDSLWSRTADLLGYPNTIEQQSFLDDPANLAATDVLIVSSGVISFVGTNRRQTIVQYIQDGGVAYIQSEWESTKPGNITFDSVMTALGAPFQWGISLQGLQSPVDVIGPLSTTPNITSTVNYFWYACTGEGTGVEPFLLIDTNEVGWVYPPVTKGPCPQVITCSDQDWIRDETDPELVENILAALAGCVSTEIKEPTAASSEVWMDGGTGVIHAVSGAHGTHQFILCDSSGREILHRRFTGSTIMTAPELGAGVYVYELRMSEGQRLSGRLARW